ncbi:hypothetical protein CLCR_07748 [Cladophialophora carrionii]|uniref:Uncharacterized protein n=1 Tax=Cladophialophora carrionii TaxID=86049 RepID=A0A1C1CQ48_9EURO|nr:hypothetical protein CLCR_07748 [Cladophialophora carrionii]
MDEQAYGMNLGQGPAPVLDTRQIGERLLDEGDQDGFEIYDCVTVGYGEGYAGSSDAKCLLCAGGEGGENRKKILVERERNIRFGGDQGCDVAVGRQQTGPGSRLIAALDI